MIENRCTQTEEHTSHPYTIEIKSMCTGLSRCGEEMHPPHTFTETRHVRCTGVCRCGLLKNIHGPGAHQ